MDSISKQIAKEFKNNEIKFHVNGKLQIVKDEYPLGTTLNDYLRNVLNLTGAKLLCKEGGCGCCAVSATGLDQTTNQCKDMSINSCIFPLHNCDGYSFTTAEGIGNKKMGLNPIQKRLADKNASQCGYCTPGFVMSMYSLLKQKPKPTKDEIEKSFDGNICRCTGYRAILESMKSFAIDENPIDIEDIQHFKCLNKQDEKQPNFFSFENGSKIWYAPVSLDDLKLFFKSANLNAIKFRFVSGNTSIGIYKNEPDYALYVNLANIKQLHQIEKEPQRLTIGSGVTLQSLIELFDNTSKTDAVNFGHLGGLLATFKRIASVHIRNVATWSGNLALKKNHPAFPSDVYAILESIDAKLNVYHIETGLVSQYSCTEYLNSVELTSGNHLIESMNVNSLDQSKVKVSVFKVAPRVQNSHSYVNCGLRFVIDDRKIINRPSIVFNGIGENWKHAEKTEQFLENSDLNNESVFHKSIEILSDELHAAINSEKPDPLLAPNNYRISTALSLYYKFILTLCPRDKLKDELKTAIDTIIDCRQVSRGENFIQAKPELYPLTKSMAKLNAYTQTTGETKYIGDIPALPGQLNGAFVLSSLANATIDSIDVQAAMNVTGVKKILFAKDIPGENNIMPKPFMVEQLFADKTVEYAGQPIGLVVAETYEQAKQAAKLVKVNYCNVKKPILTIKDALKENSFHPKPDDGDFSTGGDTRSAIEKSAHKIRGEFDIGTTQYNFFLEGIFGICAPTEDGYKIDCTTQHIDSTQKAVAAVLGLNNSSCIDMQVKQLGGGFGGKLTRANFAATAAALAANDLNVPVKVFMDLNDCMEILGRRPSYYIKYYAGFDDNGKLNGIEYEWYNDPGISPNGCFFWMNLMIFESAYKCPNYDIKKYQVKTNKASAVEIRSPDFFQSICITESVLDNVAGYLNKDPLEVRKLNLVQKNDVTLLGHKMTYVDIENVTEQLRKSAEYDKRRFEIDLFNKQNRYKKKGISLIPLKYPIVDLWAHYNAILSVRQQDGSVAISHGGIEMGQGIHTKAAQVCAHELGIPLEMISVKSTNNLVNPNAAFTGGSVTIELISKSIIGCCDILKERLEPVRKLMPENYTWKELIDKAFSMHLNLSTMSFIGPKENNGDIVIYDIDAAACTEVLIDVLTGETQVTRTDILYDCGQTINGIIDVGQVEGGFVMGLGFMLLEKTIHDPVTGRCLNHGTWEYKPPSSRDIPIDFRIKFLENKPNSIGIIGAKAVGEPPLTLSTSIWFALKHAISSAREDRGVMGFFRFDLPATIDNVQQACMINPLEFKL